MTQGRVPDGYHTVTPYLLVDSVQRQIDFLTAAFGAEVMERQEGEDGNIRHAEVKLGSSVVMMGQAQGERRPMPMMLYLYVEDADALFQRAIDAGATVVQAMADQPYGDRSGGVRDSLGNEWWIATRLA